MKTAIGIAAVVVVLVTALVGLVLLQGYAGRSALRASQLAGCQRGIADRVTHRNIALAAERGDRAVSEDPEQPARTRIARRNQADEEMRGAVDYESRIPRDQRRTPTGFLLPEFSCAQAYPKPRLIGK